MQLKNEDGKEIDAKALMDHLENELPMALQADGEHGAHWLNNVRAEEWHRNNPELSRWLRRLHQIINP